MPMTEPLSRHNMHDQLPKRDRMQLYNFVGRDIILWERNIGDDGDEIGKRVWPSAVDLCQFLQNGCFPMQDKKVLELGAGIGLVGIVASLLGADVTLTDLPNIVGNMEENVRPNTKEGCKYPPKVRPLVWGRNLFKVNGPSIHYDYVIGADVFYIEETFHDLLATLRHFCDPQTTVLLGCHFRVKSRDLKFIELLKKHFKIVKEHKIPGQGVNKVLFEARLKS
ncbi:protein N-lysine methyltransferase METTL21A-like [Branchiostoma lanceolatum]|uniref:protein N-lysine methyltransferase METTL21A-like n=1 Tax=Branchiostoma lanceolatum TaxID=7740 RepID=UPI003454F843